jgi:hypothetical protein
MRSPFPNRLRTLMRHAGTAAAIGWIAAPLSAQAPVPSADCSAPAVPCPGTMSFPARPTQPGSQPSPKDAESGPQNPSAPAGPNADPSADAAGAFGAAPSAGTGGGDTFNVNMYGDALGRHSVQVVRSRTFADFVQISRTGLTDMQYSNGKIKDGLMLSSNSLAHSLFGVQIGTPVFTAQSPLVGTSSTGVRVNSPLLENTAITSLLQHSSLVQPGETVKFVSGLAIVANPSPNPMAQQYSIYEVYDFTSSTQVATGGGVVGRQKMSEDTSPLPRDRIIFDYDFFSGATLAPGGIDVHRVIVGFEKTFFDGRTSIEVRVPFASTLDSSSEIGTQSRNTELGDIRITPRLLAYGSETLNIGVGVGFYLPTASDTRVRDNTGTELLRFSEDSLTVSPYVGVLFTPNDRLFAQSWASIDYDTRGDAVSANLDGSGLTGIGRYRNGTQLNLDAQIGYWIINASDQGRVRGLGPFVELHYGTAISDSSVLQAGDYQIGTGTQGDELNLTAGVSAQLGDRLNLQIGVGVPLISDSRNFDWQIGLRMNYFFGASAANPSRATYVP